MIYSKKPMKYNTFYFENYDFQPNKGLVTMRYSIDKKLKFKEEIRFNVTYNEYTKKELDGALITIFLLAGISYYKTYLPPNISLGKIELSYFQKKFFEEVYSLGLAELLYTNNLKQKKIRFPHKKIFSFSRTEGVEKDGSIVALGGGKDSLLASELLTRSNIPYSTFFVGRSTITNMQAKKMNASHTVIERNIDEKLKELNEKDAYNGHIPITAINSTIGVILAILTGKKYVIFANEHSANESTIPNTKINHQYSKTLRFEKIFSRYVKRYISKDIEYFSLLRPFSELKIAQLFSELCWDRYKEVFFSCNKNYALHSRAHGWCGRCPKCVFIFLIFSPFIGKSDLTKAFGDDLLEQRESKRWLKYMTGLEKSKPFECVGSIDEVRHAMYLIKGRYQIVDDILTRFEKPNFNIDQEFPNIIPYPFKEMLKDLKSKNYNKS